MKKLLNIGWVVVAVVLSSCIPDPLRVDDIAQLKPKIVVSSQLVPGGALVVLITKSISALEAGRGSDPQELISQIALADARVWLQHDNRVDSLPNLGTGLYGNINLDLQPGRDYTLIVKTVELGEVSAVTQLRQRVPFRSVQAKLYGTGFDSLAQVNYSLQDPVGPNWYMINVQRYSQKNQITAYLNPRVFTRLVRDSIYDGRVIEDEFKVLFRKFSKGDTVAVFLSNISEEYYGFLKLRNDRRYNFSAFASEPLNFNSNVKGGLGYFNLHLPDARIFVME
ncbi:MAG: DUF4249 domain-containing protein [Cyclobacteriaceae bacterium]|nr:DUF4249 domain-containing protein [Cyclobacteriaceae bacterium]